MAPRGLRYQYFLAFHKKPPAANLYREDVVVTVGDDPFVLVEGAKVDVRPGRQRKSMSVVILAIGLQKELQVLRVDREGHVYQPDEVPTSEIVGTLRDEKLKLKGNSGQAQREKHLQEIAKAVANGKPPPPGKTTKVCRLPKRLSAPEKIALELRVANLSCWEKKPGDTALIHGSPVFIDGGTLNLLKGDLADKPLPLFKAIIRLCLGDLVGEEGLCSTENGANQRDKVAVPQPIVAGAYGYCTLNCTRAVNFEPSYVLRTWLDKAKNKKKQKEGRTGPEVRGESNLTDQEMEEQTENNDGPIIISLLQAQALCNQNDKTATSANKDWGTVE